MANSLPDATGYSGEGEKARDRVEFRWTEMGVEWVNGQWRPYARETSGNHEANGNLVFAPVDDEPQQFTGDDFEAAIALQQAGTSFRC